MDVNYVASPTMAKFHSSDKFVRALLGPIGSGKSVACVIEMWKLAHLQEPNEEGIRKTRFAVIRNTYRELLDTTMETFFDWIPQDLGQYSVLNSKFVVDAPLPDGTSIHTEFLFRALDKPADIKKLLSLEITFMFLNECREIPKAVLDMGIGRCGRYPSMRDGGATRWGVIMDTNPPDSDHWFHKLFETTRPINHAIFHQPAGDGPDAENVKNLPKGYYENMAIGKDDEWVKVYVKGKYGFVGDGLPVIPEFHDAVHVSEDVMEFIGNVLYIGIDFGRTPAAVFAQEINGQVQVVDEITTFGIGATHFSKIVRERIKGHYPADIEIIATGDPAGDNPGEQVDDTCIDIMNNAGVPTDPAHTNNFTTRREAVAISLQTLTMQGVPQLIISPQCEFLRKALTGGYKYKRMQVSGEKFQNKPDKNKYSHVADALQYLMLGMGKGYDVISSHSNVKQFKVKGALA